MSTEFETPDEHIELGTIAVDTGASPDACVIWLHGLGADGHDFEGIVPQLMLPADLSVRFLFPDAPFQAVTINSGYIMRAWYDIYEDISEGAEQDAEGIISSAHAIGQLIEQQRQTGIAAQRIILAGFSQGGAVALYTGLLKPQAIGGIIALSCYLPLAERVLAEIQGHTGLPPVLMAHGDDDPVVPLRFGDASRQRLQAAGCEVDWRRYPMEHSVCGEEILDIRDWLIERLDQ